MFCFDDTLLEAIGSNSLNRHVDSRHHLLTSDDKNPLNVPIVINNCDGL